MKKSFVIIIFLFFLFSIAHAKTTLVTPKYVYQGGTFKVKLYTDKEFGKVYAHFKNIKARLYRWGDYYCGAVGVMPDEKPGIYSITISVEGMKFPLSRKIRVRSKWYPRVAFFFHPSKKKIYKRDLIAEEWARIEKVLIKENPEKLWGKKFARPVDGIVTMDFGVREFINRRYSNRHRGVDYRAKIGTIVRAPCSGIVVFAEILKAFGGTMVIDHGQGVYSIFFHLSGFIAKEGQFVNKGQRVAMTGNSGISTGPHLHYGLSVNNVRVDPTQWIKGNI